MLGYRSTTDFEEFVNSYYEKGFSSFQCSSSISEEDTYGTYDEWKEFYENSVNFDEEV